MPLSRRSFLAAAAGLAALPKVLPEVMQRAPLPGDVPLVGDAPPEPIWRHEWQTGPDATRYYRAYIRPTTNGVEYDMMRHVMNDDGSVSTFDMEGNLVMHDPGYMDPPRLTWSGTFNATG